MKIFYVLLLFLFAALSAADLTLNHSTMQFLVQAAQ